ncbi:DUF92 domain-containing protein [Pararcticibacter amylolyticus]|nr:DUF92 domain-containing protein [Pararcticibacter amylolyticus]
MEFPLLLIAGLLTGGFLSARTRKLTPGASLTGVVLALVIYLGAGYSGIAMMAAFFVLATLASSWQQNFKEGAGIAEANKGQRNISQVLANAGMAAVFGGLSFVNPENSHLFRLMMAAGFASATSDTLSSELGSVYGKNFYNILTFRRDMRGKDGVVSLEGMIAGVLGALIIALIGSDLKSRALFIICLSGISGNLADSLLGASLERKGVIGNDAVNFLSTMAASLLAFALSAI